MSRKLRIWDIKAITETLVTVTQFREKIEKLLIDVKNQGADIEINQLPDSLIPTEVLYNISLCYEAMFESLKEEDLIKSGNPRTTSNLH